MIYSYQEMRGSVDGCCGCLPSAIRRLIAALCAPVVWIYMSVYLLLFPCISVMMGRCFGALLFQLCGCCGQYTDKDEAWKDQGGCQDGEMSGFSDAEGRPVKKTVEWKRAADILPPRFSLFQDGVTPSDIKQGQLGDCWLMAAFAAAAEFPSVIKRAFVTGETNWRGCYSVRLFDPAQKKWVKITVDDRIPCVQGRTGESAPLFCQPNGGELWVLLLEKAFAKLCGGYGKLAGGQTTWALQVLTGDAGYDLRRNAAGGAWKRIDLEHSPLPGDKRHVTCKIHQEVQVKDMTDDAVYKQLVALDGQQTIMCASTSAAAGGGLVGNHAYSLIATAESGGVRLVVLRNPWGKGEWKGRWADGDAVWTQHPRLAAKVKAVVSAKREAAAKQKVHGGAGGAASDGVFSMVWEDFLTNFASIGVLRRRVDLHDIVLDTHEHEPGVSCWVCHACCGLACLPASACGPTVGCVDGCASYFCLCHGCANFCFARQTTEETEDGLRKGCCSCIV